ncbi:Semaphorin-5B [Varanus komodoensis]|nr:Semaphorin-5B [Varanus komodoensis]
MATRRTSVTEPNFIAAYDIGLFTYFFFRENAVEHDCGKTVYSRVARVCKNDIGGRFLLEDTWTTFMKARLNCSRSGEIPFYYNELQSTFYLPEQDLIYGVFTTNVNSIAASAVCAFNLSAITQAFNGPFRYQENPRSAWLPTINPIPNFQCGILNDDSPNENLTERILQDAQRLFLMNDVVQPVSVDPYVTQDNIRFSKLVVDIVQGKDTLYHVMYIGTEHGTILKALSTTNKSLRSCYLEEMQILPASQKEPIQSLQILHSDRSLFVGLNNGVLKIPLERCSMYRTEGECLGARDPYCGWDKKQRRCTTIEDSSNMSLWTQNITECPVKNLMVDGRLGTWSPWQPCEHSDGDIMGSCLCRSRLCNSPRPRCGGRDCDGARIEIANCSRSVRGRAATLLRDTEAGSVSDKAERSGSAMKTAHARYQSSGLHGALGINVVQTVVEECTLGKGPVKMETPVQAVPWYALVSIGISAIFLSYISPGSPRFRSSCAQTPGTKEEQSLVDKRKLEFKTCSPEACPEVRRNTPWTPWMPTNITQSGARQEQRFRYTCRAQLADPHDLQFGRKKTENRFCPNDGSAVCDTDCMSCLSADNLNARLSFFLLRLELRADET